jgi:hypothetical protein
MEDFLGRIWALFGKQHWPDSIILERDDELRAALLAFLVEGRALRGRNITLLQCYGETTDLVSRAVKGEKLWPQAWAGENWENWKTG